MAATAVTGGLMPHQKDEHDIWICKCCGWKYPNSKPSPKIRNNHKKHCPGKADTDARHPGGSSDDVSDDDHDSALKGSMSPKEILVDALDPQVETKSRDFDVASLKKNLKSETAPAAAPDGNGTAKAAPAQKEVTTPAAAPVSPGRLMPHQKDEHDIWICKECGWKYPNARPSPKIRKNHKKHCPGRGGPVAVGGSSDEDSDDEHHHAPAAPKVAIESGREESGTISTGPADFPPNISREIDLAALKESRGPEVTAATSITDVSPEAGNGTTESSPPALEPARLEKDIPQQPPVDIPPAVEPEEETPAVALEVCENIGEVDIAAPNESSNLVVKNKTPTASPGKTSPAIPGRKRTTLQMKAKPPWKY